MAARIKPHIESGLYKYAIILGGTNDLGFKRPDIVLDNLKSMHDLCKKHGVQSLAITIPQPSLELKQKWIGEIRSQINTPFEAYCKENNIPIIDFSRRIPYQDDSSIWDDGLHLAPKGYDMLGELVFESLQPLLGNN
eukprot:TRINITY_DN939_c1_g1_i2.p1 TRINITY_DN939_c1_g1~~TRINITY_DN939_c1_g1_i2.p1  ORF type:complete len:137 (+),score=17.54 TRINITY_DN939_c1_g1_i2:260-670(+)